MSIRGIVAAVPLQLLLLVPTACTRQTFPDPTQVLVVGTIHQEHRTNPNYTYEQLLQIVGRYDPDVICVEIRPEDFRRVPYLTEMVAATIWGSTRGRRVYPIDWWTENPNARLQRDSMMQAPDYGERKAVEDSLTSTNPVIREFDAKHGEWSSYAKTGSYEFFNGEEYNDYIAEGYRISMEVWGDSPMNLLYRTRNERMMDLIRAAIRENPGRRLIVLTGAEHKHYFDRALTSEPGVELLGLGAVLPLEPTPLDPEVRKYLTDNRADAYFDMDTPEGTDLAFAGALLPLLHGPDMDFEPTKIPASNLAKARVHLAEWQARRPDSPLLHYNLGWVAFLESSPADALGHYEIVLAHLDEIAPGQRDFVRKTIHRNIGLALDLLGKREQAIAAYEQGERLFDEMGGPAWQKQALFRDYRTVPFRMTR